MSSSTNHKKERFLKRTNVKNEKGVIIIDSMNIKKIKKYSKYLYAH